MVKKLGSGAFGEIFKGKVLPFRNFLALSSLGSPQNALDCGPTGPILSLTVTSSLCHSVSVEKKKTGDIYAAKIVSATSSS